MTWLAILTAGGLGALARWGVDTWVARVFSGRWPVGVFGINVVGSLLLGLSLGLPYPWFSVVGTGFCGAFTTFSTLLVGVFELFLTRRSFTAVTYLSATVLVCACAAWWGIQLSSR